MDKDTQIMMGLRCPTMEMADRQAMKAENALDEIYDIFTKWAGVMETDRTGEVFRKSTEFYRDMLEVQRLTLETARARQCDFMF